MSTIDVIIFTQTDDPHTSPTEKYIYPNTFKKIAIPSKMTVSRIKAAPQQLSPPSYRATNLIPAK
jgi:hypothetical protein